MLFFFSLFSFLSYFASLCHFLLFIISFRCFVSFIQFLYFSQKYCILYPLGYIIFCLSKNPSKIQAKCQAKSKQNRNRVANVADIILSYTLIGYKFAVSLFASVLLQLLLKQIPKQKSSKSNFIHSGSVNSSGLPHYLFHFEAYTWLAVISHSFL